MQGREKIHLIETFTDMGFDILVSDVDTVWCVLHPSRLGLPAHSSRLAVWKACRSCLHVKSRQELQRNICRLKDPLPYMAKYPEADILTSSDHLVSLYCKSPPLPVALSAILLRSYVSCFSARNWQRPCQH